MREPAPDADACGTAGAVLATMLDAGAAAPCGYRRVVHVLPTLISSPSVLHNCGALGTGRRRGLSGIVLRWYGLLPPQSSMPARGRTGAGLWAPCCARIRT